MRPSTRAKAMVKKRDIVEGLQGLGLGSGCKVLVHSSLKSFGQVEGGADTVIDALLEAVAPSGTILVPALTGRKEHCPENPPEFDPNTSACWTGVIPETFRKREKAVRSIHPTHSVAAIGPDANRLTCDHSRSLSPCDAFSPYGKLAQCDDGYVLFIGVGHKCNTTFHHVEEMVGVDYHMQKQRVRAKIIIDGKLKYKHLKIHQWGTPRNFAVMEPIFVEQGIQKQGKIGNSIVKLVQAKKMVEVAMRHLESNRNILCLQGGISGKGKNERACNPEMEERTS